MRNVLFSLALTCVSSLPVPFKNHINGTEYRVIVRPRPLNLRRDMWMIRNEPIVFYPPRNLMLLQTERYKLREWPLHNMK